MKEKIAGAVLAVISIVSILFCAGEYLQILSDKKTMAGLERSLAQERVAAKQAAALAVQTFNASQAEWEKKVAKFSAEFQEQIAKLEADNALTERRRAALNDYLIEVQPIVDAHSAAKQKAAAQKMAVTKSQPTTVLTYTGDGIRTSHTFDVQGTWRIRWDLSFSEADYGCQPYFSAHVESANGDTLNGPCANAQTSRIGFGESYGSGSGPARLAVSSVFCHWTVYVELLD